MLVTFSYLFCLIFIQKKRKKPSSDWASQPQILQSEHIGEGLVRRREKRGSLQNKSGAADREKLLEDLCT